MMRTSGIEVVVESESRYRFQNYLERRIDGTCLFHALSSQGEHWLGVGFGVANLAC